MKPYQKSLQKSKLNPVKLLLYLVTTIALVLSFSIAVFGATITPSQPNVGDDTSDNPYQISISDKHSRSALLVCIVSKQQHPLRFGKNRCSQRCFNS